MSEFRHTVSTLLSPYRQLAPVVEQHTMPVQKSSVTMVRKSPYKDTPLHLALQEIGQYESGDERRHFGVAGVRLLH
jgi:hypothetical protein